MPPSSAGWRNAATAGVGDKDAGPPLNDLRELRCWQGGGSGKEGECPRQWHACHGIVGGAAAHWQGRRAAVGMLRHCPGGVLR